ncbi:MAG: T9SS type A sorting domain-containing protein [Lewinellaceae bacterium]|nr:T9SS type A sorting domain-containing protein [Lewinellaceae bacterium]
MKQLLSLFMLSLTTCGLSLSTIAAQNPTWDLNFGTTSNGVVIFPLSIQDEFVYDMKLDNSKRIVCVGVKNYNGTSFSPHPFISRHNSTTGAPDLSFGVNGIVELNGSLDLSQYSDYAFSLAIQPDNKILICGTDGINPFVARFTESGAFDPTFGTGGVATLSEVGQFKTLLLQPEDGKVVAAGYMSTGISSNSEEYLVARFLPNGQKDVTFNFDGIATYSIFDDDAPGASRIVRDANNKYVICGTSNRDGTTTDDATLARLSADGNTVDFKWASYLVGDDVANDVTILPSGQIVTIGQERLSSKDYLSIKKFSAAGALEDTDLWYSQGEDDDIGYRLVQQCDGKILVLGEANYVYFNLFRLKTDFTVDESFSTISVKLSAADHPRAMVVDGNNIYVAGYLQPADGNYDDDPFIAKLIVTNQIAAPTISIAAPGSSIICPGGSSTLTAGGGCPTCSVEWYRGTQLVDQGTSISVTIPGTYTAKYVNAGCGSSATSNAITLTAGTTPPTPVITPASNTTVCVGQQYQLSVQNPCSGCTYTWSPAGAGSGQTITLNTAQAGSKAYSVVSNNGCPSQSSAAVTVNVVQAPAAPTVSPAGPIALCPGQTATLTATNIQPGLTAVWTPGNQTGPSIQVQTPGVYQARIQNGQCLSAFSNQVIVSQNPAFNAMVTITNSCYLCAPLGSNYQWYLNNQAIPGATAQCWTAIAAGSYTVSMADAYGCTGTTPAVTVQACPTATQTIESVSALQVYPNPASEQLTFELHADAPIDLDIQLFSPDGRLAGLIFRGQVNQGLTAITHPVDGLSAGLYFYKIGSETGLATGTVLILR